MNNVKLIHHSDKFCSIFYTNGLRRLCVDCDVNNGKVVGVISVWVLTKDGYNDCVVNDTKSFFEDNKELLNKLFGGTYEH